MKDKLIDFETAKLAKEKGFDEYCKGFYDKVGKLLYFIGVSKNSSYILTLSAPTQSLLQRWLREEHKIEIHIGLSYTNNLLTGYNVTLFGNNIQELYNQKSFKTYEEALEVGLLEGLSLIK